MPEPEALVKARKSLAQAERDYRSAAGLARLAEGLALLEDVIAATPGPHRRTAETLAVTYAERLYGRIKTLIDMDPALPEPDLEHFFKVVLAFDRIDAELPPGARELKIAVVRALIERYYEGHPAERKQAALRALQQLEKG